MSFAELRYLMLSDLYRLCGSVSWSLLTKSLFLGGSFGAYQYAFWLRVCQFLSSRGKPVRLFALPLARLQLQRYAHKYGIYTYLGARGLAAVSTSDTPRGSWSTKGP